MGNLSSITGITGKELKELNHITRETGISSGVGAAEAANAFTALASQVKVSKVGLEGLKNLQKETVTLAQASGIGMTEAANSLAGTITQFGLGADQANRVINVLTAGSQAGSAGIIDLAAALKVSGETALSSGVSVEQAAGALEVLSNNNLKGAEAGQTLSKILSSMQENLNIDLSQTGLSTALESLQPLIGNTGEITRIFGEENANTAQYLINNASSVAQMTTALTDTNTAQEQAAIRTDTTAEKIKQMQAVISDVQISLFETTGGFTAYAAVIGENMMVFSQLAPLFRLMKTGLSGIIPLHTAAASKTNLSTASTLRATVANTAHAIQQKAVASATMVWTAAQTALNAVINMNPIALLVTGITALIAGIIAAYKNFDSFREIMDSAWEKIKQLGAVIWDGLVKAFEKVSEVLTPLWEKIKLLLGIQEETAITTQATTSVIKEYADANEQASTSTDVLNKNIQAQNTQLKTNLETLGGIESKIATLKEAQKKAGIDQAVNLEKEIRLWQEKAKAMQNAILIKAGDTPELSPLKPSENKGILAVHNPKVDENNNLIIEDINPLKKITDNTDETQKKIVSFTGSIFGSNSIIGGWADHVSSDIQRVGGVFTEFYSMLNNDSLSSTQMVGGGLMAMGAMFGQLGSMVDGAAGSWLNWGSTLLGTIAQAIPQIIALTNTQVASATTQVVANTATAGTGAAASVASIPVVGWIMAGAAVASVIATLATLPKPKPMASGGIVYNKLFAQVGEYAGAANNPEVIAPLNKLRQLIQPVDESFGKIEFRIRGNDLLAVYNKVNHANTRTR